VSEGEENQVEAAQDVRPEPVPTRRTPGKAARNERRKAVATLLNALSAAAVITAGLQPLVAESFSWLKFAAAIAAFVVCQLVLYYILGGLED